MTCKCPNIRFLADELRDVGNVAVLFEDLLFSPCDATIQMG